MKWCSAARVTHSASSLSFSRQFCFHVVAAAAAGEDIYSSCFQQKNTWCERTGTSQATPHVLGMLARCLSGGRCKSGANGTQSVLYAIDKWQRYNQENPDYGYAMDPLRYNKVFYWGYLTCADVW